MTLMEQACAGPPFDCCAVDSSQPNQKSLRSNVLIFEAGYSALSTWAAPLKALVVVVEPWLGGE